MTSENRSEASAGPQKGPVIQTRCSFGCLGLAGLLISTGWAAKDCSDFGGQMGFSIFGMAYGDLTDGFPQKQGAWDRVFLGFSWVCSILGWFLEVCGATSMPFFVLDVDLLVCKDKRNHWDVEAQRNQTKGQSTIPSSFGSRFCSNDLSKKSLNRSWHFDLEQLSSQRPGRAQSFAKLFEEDPSLQREYKSKET